MSNSTFVDFVANKFKLGHIATMLQAALAAGIAAIKITGYLQLGTVAAAGALIKWDAQLNKIMISQDGGATWEALKDYNSITLTVSDTATGNLLPTQKAVYDFVTGQGYFISTDSGDGTKYLADDGTYKTITPGSTYTFTAPLQVDGNGAVSIDLSAYATTQAMNSALDLKLDADAAFSGDYMDLTNRPTIPTLTSQLGNDSGFVTSATAHGLPVGGSTGMILTKKSGTDFDSEWKSDSTIYSNAAPTPNTVGGIGAGTTFVSQSTKQMWDALLYPQLFPVLVAPSSTFLLTQAGLRQTGQVVTLEFSSAFSRGTITPAYGTSGFRSGLPNEYVYTGTGLQSLQSVILTDTQTVQDYTVLLGAQSWTGRVAYDAGQQPLSNKGNDYSTPLMASQTTAVTRTITGVYPWFATTVDMATDTKQALAVHNAAYYQAAMAAQSGGKQKAIFPDAFSDITGIQFYNTVSSAWQWLGGSKANSLGFFTVTDTNLAINGTSISYKVHTHNGSTIGARSLRFYTT